MLEKIEKWVEAHKDDKEKKTIGAVQLAELLVEKEISLEDIRAEIKRIGDADVTAAFEAKYPKPKEVSSSAQIELNMDDLFGDSSSASTSLPDQAKKKAQEDERRANAHRKQAKKPVMIDEDSYWDGVDEEPASFADFWENNKIVLIGFSVAVGLFLFAYLCIGPIINSIWWMIESKNWIVVGLISAAFVVAGLMAAFFLRKRELPYATWPASAGFIAAAGLVILTALFTPPQKAGEEGQQAQAGNSQSQGKNQATTPPSPFTTVSDPYASWKAGSKVWNYNWDGVSDVVKAAIFEDSEAGALCYVYWVAKNIDPNYKFVGWDRRVLVNEKRGEVNAAPIKVWAIQEEYIELYDRDCKVNVSRSVTSPNSLSQAIIAKWKETRE